MVLATYGEHPWIATLYYSSDEELNVYFLSNPETLHCKQIVENPHVALSIADSPQEPSSKKKGIQIYGLAEQISD
ncbi:pyridoxamine 5'-phosphate oxidase family protein [Candidatus Woesebacteria bacterium]|nr:pyridoxamine 5'-phosphate oxidase family protein [Candidatus Woesebacteria bacterium]